MIVMGMPLSCDSFVKVIYFKKKNLLPQKASGHSVHWGINPPSKTTPTSFSSNPLLNLQTVQAPLLGDSPVHIRFS